MAYDYERKRISKALGLTGVEGKNLARELKKMNLDPQAFDWEGALSDSKDYGDRYGSAKQKLKEYYGISLEKGDNYKKYDDMQQDQIINNLMDIFESRSHRSKIIDLNINAKKVFSPNDSKGVKRWIKNPNRFDIKGVDDLVGFNDIKDMEYPEAQAKKNISMLGDADKDNVPNIFDCKPLDPDRDGLFGRAINIVSLGRFGQSKQDYDAERTSKTHFNRDPKTGKVVSLVKDGRIVSPYEKSTDQLMKEYKEDQIKKRIAKQKAQVELLKQRVEYQKLLQKERDLKRKTRVNRPSAAQEAISMFLGFPMPTYRPIPVKKRSRRKTKKTKGSKKPSICPRCGFPLMFFADPFRGPVKSCPRCGLIT